MNRRSRHNANTLALSALFFIVFVSCGRLQPSKTEISDASSAGDASASNLRLKDFKISPHADGSVSLRSNQSGTCLALGSSDIKSDPTLSLKTCATSDLQNFSLLSHGAQADALIAVFTVISQTHGGCLTLDPNTNDLLVAKCDLSPSQRFGFHSAEVASFLYSANLEAVRTVVAGPPLSSRFKGIHLAGAESGNLTDQNRPGYNYAYPSKALIDYVARKGFGLIRLSFKAARLQPTRNGDLDPVELSRLDTVVQYANSKGLYVLLDPHDYGSMADANKTMQKIGSAAMPASNFANFWAHLASAYRNQPNVIFGLMNEPHGIDAKNWQSTAITATSAIRSVGAMQPVFIPGVFYTGAHAWIGRGNGATWANFKERNYRFEVHQYFDSDSSGTNQTCVPGAAVQRLSVFTNWALANGHTGFLGETGWAENAVCAAEGRSGFAHMTQNSNVYAGWSYFGAAWYNGFMTVNPTDLGKPTEQDKDQLKLMLDFL